MLPNLKPPLSLREAADLLGRKLFPEQWLPDSLDSQPPDRLQVVRKALYQIFASGKTTVLLIESDGESARPLEPHHTRHLSFDIRVRQNEVRLGHLPGYSFGCEIDADSFACLLAGLGSPTEAPGVEKARIWLSGCIAREQAPRQTKSRYRDEAISKFGITAAAFDRIWRDAIRQEKETNPVSKWGEPGRPLGRQKI